MLPINIGIYPVLSGPALGTIRRTFHKDTIEVCGEGLAAALPYLWTVMGCLKLILNKSYCSKLSEKQLLITVKQCCECSSAIVSVFLS